MTERYQVERIRYGGGFRVVNTAVNSSVPGEYQSEARARRAAAGLNLEFAGGKVISGFGAGQPSRFIARFMRSLSGTPRTT